MKKKRPDVEGAECLMIKEKKYNLGTKDKSKEIYLSEAIRLKNLVVVGANGTGKSSRILPALVKQDIEDKRVGATIVTGDRDTSMVLYALAKRANRDVHIIKPSLTNSGKALLESEEYSYSFIQEQIVNFERVLDEKQIVIIDMEFAQHQEDAIKGVALLLKALEEAMVKRDKPNPTAHYLYVDDIHMYMPFMKNILRLGKTYGVGSILFLDTRLYLKDEELAVLDANVRNSVFTNGLTVADAEYVLRDIYEKQIPYIRNRTPKEFQYSIVDKSGKRTTGHSDFAFLPEDVLHSLNLSIPRYRGGILRQQKPISTVPKSVLKPEVVRYQPETKEVVKEITPKEPITSIVDEEPTVLKEEKPKAKKRENVISSIRRESKRHVVILDDAFGDDEF